MDNILKILLASSSVIALNFIFKTITSNDFDKLLIPKYQKMLQVVCAFILLIALFIGYGVLFAFLMNQVKELRYTDFAIGILLLVYIIALIIIGCTCISKKQKEKKTGNEINYSEKKVEYITIGMVFLNLIIYAYFLNESYFKSGVKNGAYYWDLISCIIVFFMITYLLMKAQLYLQGFKRRRWSYVLSPTPEKIEERYLHVLYAISATQLVLSEDENSHYPTSIYLFDMTKQSYIHFERVLTLKKESK